MRADRVGRAVTIGAALLVVAGLVSCAAGAEEPASDAGADVGSERTASEAADAGDAATGSSSTADPSSADAATAEGLGALSAIDMCRWADWEADELQLVLLQGPPGNTAALPVVASDGYLEGRVGADTLELSCAIPVDGVGEYVGHQATTAVTVTLVADPDLAFVPDVDPPRPFGSESLAFGTHAIATSVEDGTVSIELTDDVYLVLTLLLDERLNDINVSTLAELAGTMTDAWDAGRVPRFPDTTWDAADVVGLCQGVLGQESLDTVLPGLGPLVLTATGERDVTDGAATSRVSCFTAAAGASRADAPSLDVDLSWAPSVSDASLAGGESHDGCVASDGLLLTCQPGWILYATVTGRWLVQTEYRDPAGAASLVTQDEVAGSAIQDAVVELGDALTVNAGRIELPQEQGPAADPRTVVAEVRSAAPVDVDCGDGIAIRGVRTERVTATVCQDSGGELTSIAGALDGNPFAGDIFAPYPTCAFVQVSGGPDLPVLLCVSEGTVEMLIEGDDAEYLGREYIDEAWFLGGPGPDVQGP